MGCLMTKLFDPSSPDLVAIRDFWHISGVILDASQPKTSSGRSRAGSSGLEVSSGNASTTDTGAKIGAIQRRPAGVLYVYNGQLMYKSRRCSLSRSAKPLQIDICDIQSVKRCNSFVATKDGKTYSGSMVDVVVQDRSSSSSLHIGFFTKQAEQISNKIEEICARHRQKPKIIIQFNSVDVEGVELDLP